MALKTTKVSFNCPLELNDILNTISKTEGITKTDILVSAVTNRNSANVMAEGGITPQGKPDKVFIETCGVLGISVALGAVGYHATSVIRKQFELDEDKGMQMAIGAIIGLASLLILANKTK